LKKAVEGFGYIAFALEGPKLHIKKVTCFFLSGEEILPF
jgi:hypothetical protein